MKRKNWAISSIDKTKFLNIGDVDQHANTAKTEQKLQQHLLDLVNQISWLVTMIGFDLQAHSTHLCMAYRRHTKKHPTSALFIYD